MIIQVDFLKICILYVMAVVLYKVKQQNGGYMKSVLSFWIGGDN